MSRRKLLPGEECQDYPEPSREEGPRRRQVPSFPPWGSCALAKSALSRSAISRSPTSAGPPSCFVGGTRAFIVISFDSGAASTFAPRPTMPKGWALVGHGPITLRNGVRQESFRCHSDRHATNRLTWFGAIAIIALPR